MRRIIGVIAFMVAMAAGQIWATSQSISFNYSTNAYLEIADASHAVLNPAGDITIETWIKPASSSPTQVLCSKYNGQYSGSFYWNMYAGGTTLFVLMDQSGANSSAFSTAQLINFSSDIGQWVHIAITIDVSEKVAKLYKNGALIETRNPDEGSATASSIKASADPFRIGGWFSGPSNPVCGSIKDFRVWSVVRTSQEISVNYNRELNGFENGLAGYWKFNGNANDETSNHNNLTPHNTISYIADVPNLSAPLPLATYQYVHFSPIPGLISNGLPEIAALRIGSNYAPLVKILDGSNNQELGQINFFDSLWTPKKVVVFDINNDNTPEISVMAVKGDSSRVESRKISDGSLVKTIILP